MLYVEREFNGHFEDIIEGLLFHLKNGGYVIVADVDVKGILKRALNFDFKNYHIFEICRPQAAKELIAGNVINGLFLPCKMVAYEDGEKTRIRLVRSSEIAKQFSVEGTSGIRKYEDELVSLFSSFSA